MNNFEKCDKCGSNEIKKVDYKNKILNFCEVCKDFVTVSEENMDALNKMLHGFKIDSETSSKPKTLIKDEKFVEEQNKMKEENDSLWTKALKNGIKEIQNLYLEQGGVNPMVCFQTKKCNKLVMMPQGLIMKSMMLGQAMPELKNISQQALNATIKEAIKQLEEETEDEVTLIITFADNELIMFDAQTDEKIDESGLSIYVNSKKHFRIITYPVIKGNKTITMGEKSVDIIAKNNEIKSNLLIWDE